MGEEKDMKYRNGWPAGRAVFFCIPFKGTILSCPVMNKLYVVSLIYRVK